MVGFQSPSSPPAAANLTRYQDLEPERARRIARYHLVNSSRQPRSMQSSTPRRNPSIGLNTPTCPRTEHSIVDTMPTASTCRRRSSAQRETRLRHLSNFHCDRDDLGGRPGGGQQPLRWSALFTIREALAAAVRPSRSMSGSVDTKGRPAIYRALDIELAALTLEEIAAQQEAQPAAALAGRAARRHSPVELEKIIDLVRRDANAGIRDRDLDTFTAARAEIAIEPPGSVNLIALLMRLRRTAHSMSRLARTWHPAQSDRGDRPLSDAASAAPSSASRATLGHVDIGRDDRDQFDLQARPGEIGLP